MPHVYLTTELVYLSLQSPLGETSSWRHAFLGWVAPHGDEGGGGGGRVGQGQGRWGEDKPHAPPAACSPVLSVIKQKCRTSILSGLMWKNGTCRTHISAELERAGDGGHASSPPVRACGLPVRSRCSALVRQICGLRSDPGSRVSLPAVCLYWFSFQSVNQPEKHTAQEPRFTPKFITDSTFTHNAAGASPISDYAPSMQ